MRRGRRVRATPASVGRIGFAVRDLPAAVDEPESTDKSGLGPGRGPRLPQRPRPLHPPCHLRRAAQLRATNSVPSTRVVNGSTVIGSRTCLPSSARRACASPPESAGAACPGGSPGARPTALTRTSSNCPSAFHRKSPTHADVSETAICPPEARVPVPKSPRSVRGKDLEFKIPSSERAVAGSSTAHCPPPGRRLRRGLFL